MDRQKQVKLKEENIQQKLREHLSRFVWEGFTPGNVQYLQQEISRATSLADERKKQEGEVKKTEGEIELKREKLEKYSRAVGRDQPGGGATGNSDGVVAGAVERFQRERV